MTKFITGTVPEDCHPKVRTLAEYWKSIGPPNAIPGRQHFDPCDAFLLLPHLVLIDVRPERPEFIWRLMSVGVSRIFRCDHTGALFLNGYQRGVQAHAYIDICKMVEDREPRWRKGAASFERDREYLTIERAFFPLARDGRTVDMVLGMILAQTTDGSIV